MFTRETYQVVHLVKQQLESIIEYKEKDLINRPAWGSVGFYEIKDDIELIFSIAEELTSLPLERLPYNVTININSSLKKTCAVLKIIDHFQIQVESLNAREETVKSIRQAAEELGNLAGSYIPYLVYKRQDIAQHTKVLNSDAEKSRKLLESAKKEIGEKLREADDIIAKAREAGASVVVASFTQEFDNEASDLKRRCGNWLKTTGLFAALTIISSMLFYYWPAVPAEATSLETLRNVLSKVAIIAVLFTGTIWCGRIYRALVHQATINRHRALSLKTFQAFVSASADERIKDSVLLAAARTIFGQMPTGLVNETSASKDTEVNVIEVARSSSEKLAEVAADA